MRLKPNMVSLEDFGKPPPPVPPAPVDWRAYIIFTLVLVTIVGGGWWSWDAVTERALAYWSSSAELADQGRFNTR
jgi:hypothetical protein